MPNPPKRKQKGGGGSGGTAFEFVPLQRPAASASASPSSSSAAASSSSSAARSRRPRARAGNDDVVDDDDVIDLVSSSSDDDRKRNRNRGAKSNGGDKRGDAAPVLNDSKLDGSRRLITLETARLSILLVAEFANAEEEEDRGKGDGRRSVKKGKGGGAGRKGKGAKAAANRVTFSKSLFAPLWRRLREQGNARSRWRRESLLKTSGRGLTTKRDVFVPPGSKFDARSGAEGRAGRDHYSSEEHVALTVLGEISTLEEVADLYAENAHRFACILPVLDRAVTEGVGYEEARRASGGGDKSVDDEGSAEDENRDECDICGDGGELVCCDNCDRAYHAYCLGTELDDLPNPWHCPSCEKGDDIRDGKPASVPEGRGKSASEPDYDGMRSNLSGVEPKVFMPVEILDADLIWNLGRIVSVSYESTCHVTVRYEGWGKEWDETLPYPNDRLARIFTYTKKVKCFVALLGGKKQKPPPQDAGGGSAKDVANWTDLWPCTATFRMPHPDRTESSEALKFLREESSRIFVHPYMAYLLPNRVQKQIRHEGQWVKGKHLRPWKDLDAKNVVACSTEKCILRELPISSAGGPPGEEGAAYYLVGDFCQAYEEARSDWIRGHLPPDALVEGALLKDEYRVRNVGGDAVNGVRYSGSFPVKDGEKQLQSGHVASSLVDGAAKYSVSDANAFDSAHPPPSEGPLFDGTAPAESEGPTQPPASKVLFVPPPSLPPPIQIVDMAYPDQGVRRLPESNRWASILRVAGSDIFLGSHTSQTEAAYAAKLASAQAELECGRKRAGTTGGSEPSEGAPRPPRIPNFRDESPIGANAGKLADLFNTPIESIVSAFEETQSSSTGGQKQPSRPRFRLRDWLAHHHRHVRHLKDLAPASGQDVRDGFSFVVEVKDGDGVGRKRRKKSVPKRLHVQTTEGK